MYMKIHVYVCASIHRHMTHEYRMHDSESMQESLVQIVEQFTIQMKPAFPWWAVCLTVCHFSYIPTGNTPVCLSFCTRTRTTVD